MAILDVLEYFDPTGEIMIMKLPEDGSSELRLGTQLVVQESQTAVFFRDGRALDAFEAGRHTLQTRNLPLLAGLLGLAFGKSPFRTYVCFIATKTFYNLGWGTPTAVAFRDADLRMVNLRAYGSYAVRITKPRAFLTTIVGTRGIETTFALSEYLRSIIVARYTAVVGEQMKSILDLPRLYSSISAGVKNAVREDFAQYGMELVDLLIEAITPPPEVQEMINKATGIEAQNVGKYQAIAAADALRTAAARPGGGGPIDAGMGAGLGLGMGIAMANQFRQATGGMAGGGAVGDPGVAGVVPVAPGMAAAVPVPAVPQPPAAPPQPPPAPPPPAPAAEPAQSRPTAALGVKCPSCRAVNRPGAKFCTSCGATCTPPQPPPAQETIACDKCGTKCPKGSKFCSTCGDPFNPCPRCGTDNAVGAVFCRDCGGGMKQGA